MITVIETWLILSSEKRCAYPEIIGYVDTRGETKRHAARARLALGVGAIVLLLGMSMSASADDNAERYIQRESVKEYIAQISAEHGLDSDRVTQLFSTLERQQSILDAISRPAERTLSWREYRPIFLTQKRIDGGKAFMREHAQLLQDAEDRFGVPASIITAIIGVETYYGRITGSYGVLEALATLSFDYAKRSAFFSREMTEFILLSEAEEWDTVNVKGSYAGAMGMPQFIASSYRQYSVDFDGDGKRDLFSSHADIIGSVGNYLARHGWIDDAPIAERWVIDSGISKSMRALVRDSLSPAIDRSTVKALGFDSPQLERGTENDRLLSVMSMAGEQGDELWVGYRNFYAITRYNHSRLYAMAVFQLSDAISSSTP